MKRRLYCLLVLTPMVLFAPQARAAEILVAAASDLSGAIRELASAFGKSSGHTVKVTLGSSGNFHTQIKNGAPFDVYLSADVAYVRDLEKAGLTEPGTVATYAVGRIVVWAPKTSPLAVETLGMKALTDSRARKIAVANPAHAPYGRAAVDAMKSAGLYDAISSKLVLGENIAQTAQFAQSGAADIGIVALSLAIAEPMKSQGKYWEIPASAHPRIEQGAAVLMQARKAGRVAAAQAFLEVLRGATGQAVLKRFGFGLPNVTAAR